MSERRQLRITRGSADRDPMFAAIWYDGASMTLTRSEPEPEPEPELPLQLPPLPPPAPQEAKWKALVERADDVNTVLHTDPDFDPQVLLETVCNLIDLEPTVEEIVTAYRRRMEAKRNG